MDAQREMTLDEWVGTLPPIHSARTELDQLRRQLAEAEERADRAAAELDFMTARHEECTAYMVSHQGRLIYSNDGMRQAYSDERVRADTAESKLALAEQDGKRLDYMLHWHATTLTDGNGWRVAFEYTSPATYATVKKYQTQREAIDAAIAAGEGKGD